MAIDRLTNSPPRCATSTSAGDTGSSSCPVCHSRQTLGGGSLIGRDGREYDLRVWAECGSASLVVADQSLLQACSGEEYYSQNAALSPSVGEGRVYTLECRAIDAEPGLAMP